MSDFPIIQRLPKGKFYSPDRKREHTYSGNDSTSDDNESIEDFSFAHCDAAFWDDSRKYLFIAVCDKLIRAKINGERVTIEVEKNVGIMDYVYGIQCIGDKLYVLTREELWELDAVSFGDMKKIDLSHICPEGKSRHVRIGNDNQFLIMFVSYGWNEDICSKIHLLESEKCVHELATGALPDFVRKIRRFKDILFVSTDKSVFGYEWNSQPRAIGNLVWGPIEPFISGAQCFTITPNGTMFVPKHVEGGHIMLVFEIQVGDMNPVGKRFRPKMPLKGVDITPLEVVSDNIFLFPEVLLILD